ncbi:hypothetical protein BCR42DRAFT_442682 [Absidia repens]|uniref:Uncharacterized protein n=1 Tax=Absidia repens TaxID=90262 RepID=A0A1X2I1C3_9FUNG|nr:hypothetical protein BCR42DRAFT_442682 [Absidia repens]
MVSINSSGLQRTVAVEGNGAGGGGQHDRMNNSDTTTATATATATGIVDSKLPMVGARAISPINFGNSLYLYENGIAKIHGAQGTGNVH